MLCVSERKCVGEIEREREREREIERDRESVRGCGRQRER